MSGNEQSLRLPACMNCSRRKTKCDRVSPCSSCVAAKIQCHFTQKRSEKRPRVLQSNRYEESLTYISNQLEDLSTTLHSLVADSEFRGGEKVVHNFNSTLTTDLPKLPLRGNVRHSNDFGNNGEPSFYSQSEKIADTLGLAVSSASENVVNAQARAVSIVHTLLDDARTARSPAWEEDSLSSSSYDFSLYPDLVALKLPPMELVLRLLTFTKSTPQRYFIEFPHTNEEGFADLCQQLYFPTRSFTIFAWINVNCGLFHLFRDLHASCHQALRMNKSQISDAIATCSLNVDAAVRSLRLCINPSLEAVDALICAAAVSMQNGNGSLGWNLVSSAARMSLDLGYHHLPSDDRDRLKRKKRKLFWYVYATDKSLAFNFGRCPTIQDYDITTEKPGAADDFESKWGFSFIGYIDFARTQYQIYEQILSPKAQQEPLSVRVQRVHEFAAQLSQIKAKFTKTQYSGSDPLSTDADQPTHSIDIGFYSILSLIYRVLPPDNPNNVETTAITGEQYPLRFHTLCVETGRAALNALVHASDMIAVEADVDSTKIFMNWTMLFIPLKPYLAVFGNQIATGNKEDLTLLRKVTKIVEKAVEVNSALNKLHKACLRLLRIAEQWTSMNEDVDRRQAQKLHAASTTAMDEESYPSLGVEQPLSVDTEMPASNVAQFTVSDWQDTEMLHQDWDTMFNDFELGLGAESARDMVPWFEQHMNSFNTFG